MRRFWLLLSLGAGVFALLTPAAAHAQTWYGPPAAYGPDPRAYRHFLYSRSSYRTYSAWPTAYALAGPAVPPVVAFYAGSSYLHQRITPAGIETPRFLPPLSGPVVPPYYNRFYNVPLSPPRVIPVVRAP